MIVLDGDVVGAEDVDAVVFRAGHIETVDHQVAFAVDGKAKGINDWAAGHGHTGVGLEGQRETDRAVAVWRNHFRIRAVQDVDGVAGNRQLAAAGDGAEGNRQAARPGVGAGGVGIVNVVGDRDAGVVDRRGLGGGRHDQGVGGGGAGVVGCAAPTTNRPARDGDGPAQVDSLPGGVVAHRAAGRVGWAGGRVAARTGVSQGQGVAGDGSREHRVDRLGGAHRYGAGVAAGRIAAGPTGEGRAAGGGGGQHDRRRGGEGLRAGGAAVNPGRIAGDRAAAGAGFGDGQELASVFGDHHIIDIGAGIITAAAGEAHPKVGLVEVGRIRDRSLIVLPRAGAAAAEIAGLRAASSYAVRHGERAVHPIPIVVEIHDNPQGAGGIQVGGGERAGRTGAAG